MNAPNVPSVEHPEFLIIVGCPRSGTKFLLNTMRNTFDIGFWGEPGFVVPTYRRLNEFGDLRDANNLQRLVDHVCDHCLPLKKLEKADDSVSSKQQVLALVREPSYTGVLYAVFQAIALRRGNTRLGYKDPGDTFHLPLLAELFPSSRFIHIIRDGRDVAISFLKFRWGPTNLYSGAAYWAQSVSKARKDGAALGDRYYEVRLEDITFNTEEAASNLGAFINQGNNPEQVQNFIKEINEKKNPELLNVWQRKMTSSQRYLCEAAAGDVLQNCGYPLEFDGKARISTLKNIAYRSTNFIGRAKNYLVRRVNQKSGSK